MLLVLYWTAVLFLGVAAVVNGVRYYRTPNRGDLFTGIGLLIACGCFIYLIISYKP